MPRQTALNLALLLCLAVAAAPALAGKGGNSGGGGSGGSGGTASSSIAIASVDGVTAAGTRSPAPARGDAVTFATSVEPIAGWEYPMVVVSCFQDVNGDGNLDMSTFSPDKVYAAVDKPDATFTLGGAWSKWTDRGGSATCHAELDAYGWKANQQSIRVLATTASWVAAG
jgi:hypothetical protein